MNEIPENAHHKLKARLYEDLPSISSRGFLWVTLEVLGTLLGQNLSGYLPSSYSSRVLMVAWLVFAFMVGTFYRGNLTASLTLPKYPPRPETLEELANYVDRYSYFFVYYFYLFALIFYCTSENTLCICISLL